MPEMAAVAARRTADSQRLLTGTREMSSTVTSSASGGQAAMAWLIGWCGACRMLAATDAATPRVRVARTAQRTRCRLVVIVWSPFADGALAAPSGFGTAGATGRVVTGRVVGCPVRWRAGPVPVR